jgi:3-isopropylmalate dehydrogenase
MKTLKVAVLAGDGIGPEVMAEALAVLRALETDCAFEFREALVGGSAIDAAGSALHEDTMQI